MRADRTTLAELTRLVQRDQGIMGVSRAGKAKTRVTVANVSVPVCPYPVSRSLVSRVHRMLLRWGFLSATGEVSVTCHQKFKSLPAMGRVKKLEGFVVSVVVITSSIDHACHTRKVKEGESGSIAFFAENTLLALLRRAVLCCAVLR